MDNQQELNVIANVSKDFFVDDDGEVVGINTLNENGISGVEFKSAVKSIRSRKREIDDDGWLSGEVDFDDDTTSQSIEYIKSHIS